MDKKKTTQNIAIIVLGIAIIIMSVGYAAYATTLEINGNATAKAAKWDIHFDNIRDEVVPTTPGSSGTSSITSSTLVEFDTVLIPNEKYSFKVDVVNGGTFDAKLDSITGTGYYEIKDPTNTSWLATQTPITVTNNAGVMYLNDYLKYTVTYDDASHTPLVAGTSGDSLPKKTLPGSTKTLLVTVEYFQPTSEADLPPVDTRYHFELDLKYVQD